ncbi:hypothetical protein BDV93DRAFT_173761 [Ceratobasidium sp. AG-I]|nr:hypothetical protein BDV93DRAFT_173761 [Ceratobasidium sp. AG-I]
MGLELRSSTPTSRSTLIRGLALLQRPHSFFCTAGDTRVDIKRAYTRCHCLECQLGQTIRPPDSNPRRHSVGLLVNRKAAPGRSLNVRPHLRPGPAIVRADAVPIEAVSDIVCVYVWSRIIIDQVSPSIHHENSMRRSSKDVMAGRNVTMRRGNSIVLTVIDGCLKASSLEP